MRTPNICLTDTQSSSTATDTLTFKEVEQRHVGLLEVVVHVVFSVNHLPM